MIILLTQLERLKEDQIEESRGQKDVLHATLAKMQTKRGEEWNQPQSGIEGKGILNERYENPGST